MIAVPLTCCLALAAVSVARRLSAGVWVQATAALVIFQLLASAGALLAGLTHPTVLYGWVLACLGLGLRLRRPLAPITLSLQAGGAVLVATLSLWALRTGLLPPRLSYDDSTYHAAMPVAWLVDGGLHLVPHCYQSYYPLHAELLTYFFALGAGDLTHVGLAPLLHALTLAAATLGLAERLDQDRNTTAALIAALLIGRRAYHAAYSSTGTDLAVAGLVLAAAALVLKAGDRRELLLGGVAAGLAISTKVPAVVPLGVLGLWGLVAHRARVLWFAVPLLLLGSPFYLHNLWLTGNPLFPAATLGFEGPLDRETQYLTSLRPYLDGPAGIWTVIRTRLNWPTPLGLAALVGLGVGLGDARERPERGVLAVMGLLPLLVFPFQPFSGTVNRPDDGLNTIVRYLFPSMALGLFLLGRWRGRGWAVLWLAVLLLSLDVIHTWELLLALVLALGATWKGSRTLPAWTGPVLAGAFAVAVLAATPEKRSLFRERDRFAISRSSLRQLEATAALDTLPAGSVIAQVSDLPVVQDHSVRPWGGRLQHRYQPVDLDGTALRPLHERWRDEPPGWWWRWEADYSEDFLANLVDSGVDYLLVTRCNASNRWPPIRERLQEHPNRRVFWSRCGEIWRVSTRSDPGGG